jgi:hypothetical protein
MARAKMELDAYGMIHDSAHEVAMQAADAQQAAPAGTVGVERP